jgi:thiol:disulfide interchange protein DsbC
MIEAPLFPPRWMRLALGLAGLAGLSAVTGWAAAQVTAQQGRSPAIEDVRAALKLRLPKTPVDAVRCSGFGGLCEVASRNTLFYVDAHAKYLVIGRIYDMEARQDLTAARLLALNPDLLAAGAARKDDVANTQHSQAPKTVSLSGLPAKGAIHWGPANGPRVTVFSDFECGYCKKLTDELKTLGARVEERPISIFGRAARATAEQVLCATDPAAALHKAYEHDALPVAPKCDTSGLDANEAFAKAHGFQGTPVIVRPSDGAVLEGYRDAATLRAFLSSPRTQR